MKMIEQIKQVIIALNGIFALSYLTILIILVMSDQKEESSRLLENTYLFLEKVSFYGGAILEELGKLIPQLPLICYNFMNFLSTCSFCKEIWDSLPSLIYWISKEIFSFKFFIFVFLYSFLFGMITKTKETLQTISQMYASIKCELEVLVSMIGMLVERIKKFLEKPNNIVAVVLLVILFRALIISLR